jgi:competence protein ComEA
VQAWLLVTLAAAVRLGARVVVDARTDDRHVAVARLVDVNRASIAELATLPGIGRGRARALVLHRVRHGAFRRLSDLAAVDGLGPITVRELARHLQPLPP